MPFALRDRAQIHWNEQGQGEPIIMIMGLGCDASLWYRLSERLAKHFRVITLDNRGSGNTTVDFYVLHSVPAMAGDVVAVLNEAGEDSAHLVGFSMGGMIAQELTIEYPERVRSLTLLGTNCGRAFAALAETPVLNLLMTKGSMSPEEALRAMEPYTYAAETPPSRIQKDRTKRLAAYPTQRDYRAQVNGLMAWTSYRRLDRIRVATLILHGEQDRLIPVENARILAQKIPHAEVLLLPESSHWLMTDQPDEVYHAVRRFLKKCQRDQLGAS